MKKPQRNSWLYFIVRRLLISPETFLQFWEKMKIRRWHFRAIRWVIIDGKSKGSNLCSSSRTYVESGSDTLKESATPCEDELHRNLAFNFPTAPHYLSKLMVVPAGTNFDAHVFNFPENFASRRAVLNFFGAGDSCWPTPFTVSCSQARRWISTAGTTLAVRMSYQWTLLHTQWHVRVTTPSCFV